MKKKHELLKTSSSRSIKSKKSGKCQGNCQGNQRKVMEFCKFFWKIKILGNKEEFNIHLLHLHSFKILPILNN